LAREMQILMGKDLHGWLPGDLAWNSRRRSRRQWKWRGMFGILQGLG